MGEAQAEVGEAEELLTDNAPLALHGALWELDQKLALHAPDDAHLIAAAAAYAEQLMEKARLAGAERAAAGGLHRRRLAGGGG